jgi:putative SOS response-associated peptidase YedK
VERRPKAAIDDESLRPKVIPFEDRRHAMCHRYNLRSSASQLVEEFALDESPEALPESSDRFATYPVAVIRLSEAGGRELITAEWGFLPRWWKPSGQRQSRKGFQRRCINAVSEEVHAKPSYRKAFQTQRAIVPATAFFEGGQYFERSDGRPLGLAGLWEHWAGDGEEVVSCTILTTAANELVAQFHPRKRMPVVLDGEDAYRLWLSPDVTAREPLEHLLQPFEPKKMRHYPAKT